MDHPTAPAGTPDFCSDHTSRPLGSSPPRDIGDHGLTRTAIVVILVVVALVIGAVTAFLLVADQAGIHDGAGAATFTWTPVAQNATTTASPEPQPFSAEIEGHTVTGTSTLVLPAGGGALAGLQSGKLPTAPVALFRYQGEFAGNQFDLTVSYKFPSTFNLSEPASFSGIRIIVTGHYGASPVTATVTSASPNGPTSKQPAHFSGSIGHWKVTGTISPTTGNSTHQTATASFVVSG